MSPKPKRVNKTKEQLIAELAHREKMQRMATLAKLMWPFVESQQFLYDAQTVFGAIAGYLELGLKQKEETTNVSDLGVDLSKEKDSLIKSAMLDILGLVEHENARDMVTLSRKLSDAIGQYGASEFVKGPMENLKITDLVT